MNSVRITTFIILLQATYSMAQPKGCTDPQALNYNSTSVENDGSCIYNKTSSHPMLVCPKLDNSISESSGLMYYNNWFWTNDDSGNPPVLYAFDSISGAPIHRTFIANASNTDWEDISQDSQYIYIGDFGNNDGNRKDLHILKIRKSDLKFGQVSDTVFAQIIRFRMADQLNFNNSSQNHNYDMEAMCFLNDSLHLFSKNWVDKFSRHYVCPADSGTYALLPRESLNVNGQITGACTVNPGLVVLTGYNKTDFSCFIWMMWNNKGNQFLSGNRRRIEVGNITTIGQNEGICSRNYALYISNEKNLTEAQMNRVEIYQWLIGKTTGINKVSQNVLNSYFVRDNELQVTIDTNAASYILHIYDSYGKLVKQFLLSAGVNILDIEGMAPGIYYLFNHMQYSGVIILN